MFLDRGGWWVDWLFGHCFCDHRFIICFAAYQNNRTSIDQPKHKHTHAWITCIIVFNDFLSNFVLRLNLTSKQKFKQILHQVFPINVSLQSGFTLKHNSLLNWQIDYDLILILSWSVYTDKRLRFINICMCVCVYWLESDSI